MEQESTIEVSGRDLMASLPRKVTVSSEEIREALKDPVDSIIRAIKDTLEKTPPELSADLCEKGITICGGGSLLRGIDKAIRKEIDIPVKRADDPMTCVVRGAGVVIEHLDSFKDTFESDEDVS